MLRLFLVFVPILHCAYSACPDGWDLVDGRECRGLYARVDTFNDEALDLAVSKCGEILATPIIIHNDKEQAYWTKRMRKEDASGSLNAMGLYCNRTAKKYEWIDGSPVDYFPEGNYNTIFDADSCDNYAYAVMMTPDVPGYAGYWGETSYEYHLPCTADIFCVMPLRQPLPSEDGCDGFAEDSEDGACYQIGAASKTWRDAQLTCSTFGAIVASIHNDEENSFIRRLAVSKNATGGLYLGASQAGKGNEFEWIDGSKWDYDKFYPGFPAAGLGDCLMMDTAVTTGDWANVDCTTELSVACQRPRNFTNPCSTGPWYEGQIIFSPGFPFDASISCDYILSVDAGKKVELEVLLLEANPCCDNMIIYENYFGTNIIANLTGIINGSTYTTSSSNYMRVSWQPNGGVNVRGMMITFRGV